MALFFDWGRQRFEKIVPVQRIRREYVKFLVLTMMGVALVCVALMPDSSVSARVVLAIFNICSRRKNTQVLLSAYQPADLNNVGQYSVLEHEQDRPKHISQESPLLPDVVEQPKHIIERLNRLRRALSPEAGSSQRRHNFVQVIPSDGLFQNSGTIMHRLEDVHKKIALERMHRIHLQSYPAAARRRESQLQASEFYKSRLSPPSRFHSKSLVGV